MNNPYFFYQLNNAEWLEVQGRADLSVLLLECQPYGSVRAYRIASLIPLEYKTFVDKGRTIGWWQCLFGKGIYRVGKKRPKLPKEAIDIISQLPDAELSITGDTWAQIIESWVQILNSGKDKQTIK